MEGYASWAFHVPIVGMRSERSITPMTTNWHPIQGIFPAYSQCS